MSDLENQQAFQAPSSLKHISSFIAWRFFRGGEKASLVSLISTISICGMALAISILILVLSVMNGFEKEFRDKILGLAPHARLRFEEPTDNWQTLQQQFAAGSQIKHVFPFTEFKALAINKNQAAPLSVQGVDVSRLQHAHSQFITFDKNYDIEKPLAHGQIVLGMGLVKQLDLKLGDTLRLLLVNEASAGINQREKTNIHSFRIVGIMQTGTELDNAVGLMNLMQASQIKNLGTAVEGLLVQVNDIFNARQIVWQLANDLNIYGHLSDWTREFGNLYTAIQLSRQLVVMLVASIVAVAVFNIFVTLGMVVRHKQNEIAILRTMGMQRSTLLRSLMWQGIYISLPGCLFGLIGGVLLTWLAPFVVSALQSGAGVELLSTEIYPIDYLPSEIKVFDVFFIIAMALGLAFIATIYPAWQATRLKPAEVLKSNI